MASSRAPAYPRSSLLISLSVRCCLFVCTLCSPRPRIMLSPSFCRASTASIRCSQHRSRIQSRSSSCFVRAGSAVPAATCGVALLLGLFLHCATFLVSLFSLFSLIVPFSHPRASRERAYEAAMSVFVNNPKPGSLIC
jgi:hypothetical protein